MKYNRQQCYFSENALEKVADKRDIQGRSRRGRNKIGREPLTHVLEGAE